MNVQEAIEHEQFCRSVIYIEQEIEEEAYSVKVVLDNTRATYDDTLFFAPEAASELAKTLWDVADFKQVHDADYAVLDDIADQLDAASHEPELCQPCYAFGDDRYAVVGSLCAMHADAM